MASCAAFSLHRDVLKHEWALQIAMAFETDLVPACCGSYRMWERGSMRAVAIAAAKETLVHSVPKRFGEIGLLVSMAAVTQVRLFLYEQSSPLLRKMRVVTIETAQAIGRMRRCKEVCVLGVALVTRKATCIDGIGSCAFKNKNLGFVAAATDVFSSRAVAGLARMDLYAGLGLQQVAPVARPLQAIKDFFVASLTGVRSDISALAAGAWLLACADQQQAKTIPLAIRRSSRNRLMNKNCMAHSLSGH